MRVEEVEVRGVPLRIGPDDGNSGGDEEDDATGSLDPGELDYRANEPMRDHTVRCEPRFVDWFMWILHEYESVAPLPNAPPALTGLLFRYSEVPG